MVVERLDERSYEVETTDGSSYRRNKVHFKRTNEPPLKLTFEESPKASSYPDDTGDRVHLEESFNTEEAPCIRPCKDTVEQDLVGMTRTRSGRIVKRPGHLKDYATWRLATEHWTLNLLLAFEAYVISELRLLPLKIGSWTLKKIFLHVTPANSCSWSFCLCVIDIELATVHDLAFFAIYSDLVQITLVLFCSFFILGRMWYVVWHVIASLIPRMCM